MSRFTGRSLSTGVALGSLRLLPAPGERGLLRKTSDPEREMESFHAGMEKVSEELQAQIARTKAEGNREAAALLEAHCLLLRDPGLVDGVKTLITEENLTAEAAVTEVIDSLAEKIAGAQDEYLRARAADIRDVGRRLSRALEGDGEVRDELSAPCILLARELLPGELLGFPREKLLGIVTEEGSSAGHTAILARAMGIPMVTGIKADSLLAFEERQVLLDADHGEVITEPDEERLKNLKLQAPDSFSVLSRENPRDGFVLPKDRPFAVLATIDSPREAQTAIERGAAGIGLYRSELLFLERGGVPSEEEQLQAYGEALRAAGDRPVVIRTLDLGGEKQWEGSGPRDFGAPAGPRGLRYLLLHPELFRTQLRALYRASAMGKLCILFPMVTGEEEVRAALELCEQVKAELMREGLLFDQEVKRGVMIETPAAAVLSDRLGELADFFACGINDLTQYTLAADRRDSADEALFRRLHPAVKRLLEQVCDSAAKNGIPVILCTELEMEPESVSELFTLGLDALSVPLRSLPEV